jgi:hypothetical protein
MSANEMQVGGDHYKSSYQHWDLAVKIPLGFLDGCVTKHVTRWRKKLGIQDLQKAAHYLDKLLEVGDYSVKRNPDVSVSEEVEQFAEKNCLTFLEYQFIYLMCTYDSEKTLKNARRILQMIIIEAREAEPAPEMNVPGTPEDGGEHSRYP